MLCQVFRLTTAPDFKDSVEGVVTDELVDSHPSKSIKHLSPVGPGRSMTNKDTIEYSFSNCFPHLIGNNIHQVFPQFNKKQQLELATLSWMR